jgi:hypothetical protein
LELRGVLAPLSTHRLKEDTAGNWRGRLDEILAPDTRASVLLLREEDARHKPGFLNDSLSGIYQERGDSSEIKEYITFWPWSPENRRLLVPNQAYDRNTFKGRMRSERGSYLRETRVINFKIPTQLLAPSSLL